MLTVLAVAGCAQATQPTAAPPDVQIKLACVPEPPAVGESTLVITLTEGEGTPVDGASIHVEGNMDHAGMDPSNGETSTGSNGEYRVPFEWTMGGDWLVTVTATLPDGGEVSQTFPVFVEAVSSNSIIHQSDNDEEMDMGGD